MKHANEMQDLLKTRIATDVWELKRLIEETLETATVSQISKGLYWFPMPKHIEIIYGNPDADTYQQVNDFLKEYGFSILSPYSWPEGHFQFGKIDVVERIRAEHKARVAKISQKRAEKLSKKVEVEPKKNWFQRLFGG